MRISDWSSDVCSSDLVALGQKAYVDGPLVQPVEVVEDSRYPMNARCVWAGRARVKMLWLRGNGEKQPFEVTLGEETQLADGNSNLESVPPAKRTDILFQPTDYPLPSPFHARLQRTPHPL